MNSNKLSTHSHLIEQLRLVPASDTAGSSQEIVDQLANVFGISIKEVANALNLAARWPLSSFLSTEGSFSLACIAICSIVQRRPVMVIREITLAKDERLDRGKYIVFISPSNCDLTDDMMYVALFQDSGLQRLNRLPGAEFSFDLIAREAMLLQIDTSSGESEPTAIH